MLKIAVCDDIATECEQVKLFAETFFKTYSLNVKFDIYNSMVSLLESGISYDLYYLDVLMPELTGIDGAEQLLHREGSPVIVFITSMLESAVDGYRVNASGFLLKPLQEKAFNETMERVMRQKLVSHDATLSIVYNHVTMKLPLDQIVLLENQLHRVHIKLVDGHNYTISQKLSELQEKLMPYANFLRCHQSYIVNLDYVKTLEDTCFLMNDGQRVPISRAYYKPCKSAYYHYRLS